jgi:hypothetical protein
VSTSIRSSVDVKISRACASISASDSGSPVCARWNVFAPLLHKRPAPLLSFPKRLRFEAHHNLAERPARVSIAGFAGELAAKRSWYRCDKIPALMPSLEISGIGHAMLTDGTV